jgi:hypothetical protein
MSKILCIKLYRIGTDPLPPFLIPQPTTWKHVSINVFIYNEDFSRCRCAFLVYADGEWGMANDGERVSMNAYPWWSYQFSYLINHPAITEEVKNEKH